METLRKFISQVLEETISNYIKPQPQTATKLEDDSKPVKIGDPLKDIQLNSMDGNTKRFNKTHGLCQSWKG